MSLPAIVDVAIGLIFIYLILSLLASEIQEFITTIFQWRSKHLRESIEILLNGGIPDKNLNSSQVKKEILKAKKLVNKIYQHPLINSLNYDNEKSLPNSFARYIRSFNRVFNQSQSTSSEEIEYKTKEGKQTFGNKTSAPSYIPSETFANTMVETLQVNKIVRELQEDRIENFKIDFIGNIEYIWNYISIDTTIGEEDKFDLEKSKLIDFIEKIADNLKNGNLTWTIATKQIVNQLEQFQDIAQNILPECKGKRNFIREIKLLRQNIYIDKDRGIWLGSYQTGVAKIIKAFKEIKDPRKDPNNPIYQKIKELKIEGEQNSEKILDLMPDSLIDVLVALADCTEAKIDDVEEELNQFKKAIEQWFERGMDRAAGVYKRNAKGVAFLIGLLIAIATNADIFHIASRLSKDSVVREVIVRQANQVQDSDDFQKLDRALENISLPIGWSELNIKQQQEQREKWQVFHGKLGKIKQILGWGVSGIAIAMGAPFWFDIMSRIIKVRNTGKKITSSSK